MFTRCRGQLFERHLVKHHLSQWQHYQNRLSRLVHFLALRQSRPIATEATMKSRRSAPRSSLPVVGLLKVGVVAAGMGAAALVVPGVAAADEGTSTASASTATHNAQRAPR